MRRAKLFGLVALVATAAACVPQRPTPPPQPRQPPPRVQPPVRIPQPPPPPPRADWRDIPLTPGSWVYRQQGDGSEALFGPAGGAAFSVRCNRASRQVVLSRAGRIPPGGTMTVRTSETARSLPVTAQVQPVAYVSAALDARDPLLDNMAFSRGRFSIETPGSPMLVIPAWPEPARVIEDCRG